MTNAIRHAAGEAVTLGIRCARGQFRVDVHDTALTLPVSADVLPRRPQAHD
jgi:nitrate/nitrite-specific signal transduction histidine kinase